MTMDQIEDDDRLMDQELVVVTQKINDIMDDPMNGAGFNNDYSDDDDEETRDEAVDSQATQSGPSTRKKTTREAGKNIFHLARPGKRGPRRRRGN